MRGDSALVPGPGHSRVDRSLSVKPDPAARNGYILNSFAGDDFAKCRDYVDSQLGIPQEPRPHAAHNQPRGRIVATYPYHNEHGELLYEVVRYEPKDFRQRRPDGRGGWTWKLDDTRRIPYRLRELVEAIAAGRTVVVVEVRGMSMPCARWGSMPPRAPAAPGNGAQNIASISLGPTLSLSATTTIQVAPMRARSPRRSRG